MRPYEVMVIFDAELEEETIRSAVERSIQLIESKGAERGQIDWWGKRRFAYELKHRWEGYYVVFQAKAEPAAMDELHRTLSLADEVLRHKILRIPEHVYGNLTGVRRRRTPEGGSPMPDSTVTVVGNLTRDPEIRYTTGGAAKASFGMAVSRRWQNRQSQEWEEQTSFFNVVCWREMAENVSESLGKGSRVVVTGRLEQRSWETENGEKRSVVEIVADEVGPSLRWATAQVTRNERRGGGDFGGGGGGGGSTGGGRRWRRRRRPPSHASRPRTPTTTSARSPSRWHASNGATTARAPRPTAAGRRRRRSRSSTPSRWSGSTTRTSTCSGGSCPSGRRSGPAASPATPPSSSVRWRRRSASPARWRSCRTACGR